MLGQNQPARALNVLLSSTWSRTFITLTAQPRCFHPNDSSTGPKATVCIMRPEGRVPHSTLSQQNQPKMYRAAWKQHPLSQAIGYTASDGTKLVVKCDKVPSKYSFPAAEWIHAAAMGWGQLVRPRCQENRWVPTEVGSPWKRLRWTLSRKLSSYVKNPTSFFFHFFKGANLRAKQTKG